MRFVIETEDNISLRIATLETKAVEQRHTICRLKRTVYRSQLQFSFKSLPRLAVPDPSQR